MLTSVEVEHFFEYVSTVESVTFQLWNCVVQLWSRKGTTTVVFRFM